MTISLGVPQGSVLESLFFLVVINDLAYSLDLECKTLADNNLFQR